METAQTGTLWRIVSTRMPTKWGMFDAIGKTAVGDDDLPVGAVRAHRVNTTTAQLENEQSANRAFAA